LHEPHGIRGRLPDRSAVEVEEDGRHRHDREARRYGRPRPAAHPTTIRRTYVAINDLAGWPEHDYRVPVTSSRLSVTVPFLDLGLVHADLRDDVLTGISSLIETSAFTNGPDVREFESAFAAYCGVEHCVGVASGLDALRLGLQALGLSPGDRVVVPANTFVATAEAVTQAGGVPVLVDVAEHDYNLDVGQVVDAIAEGARGVLPVHLYGQMADMRAINEVAEKANAFILEDACQAHGAERDGIRAGSAGAAGAFSFYPGKNLGAFGDAGALVTDDEDIADEMRALREHGQRSKYHHDAVGWTARLDTIQALVLARKLAHLDGWNAQRRAAADQYFSRLAGIGDLVLPSVADGSEHVWHLFVVRTEDPEALGAYLRERGVATGRHYPQPVHLTTAYAHLGYAEGSFPISELLARSCLSLPIFPGIQEAQVDRVCDLIEDYFARG
jgi:dTDP-4-amino-4,6-dideoxygalactose transaminase